MVEVESYFLFDFARMKMFKCDARIVMLAKALLEYLVVFGAIEEIGCLGSDTKFLTLLLTFAALTDVFSTALIELLG